MLWQVPQARIFSPAHSFYRKLVAESSKVEAPVHGLDRWHQGLQGEEVENNSSVVAVAVAAAVVHMLDDCRLQGKSPQVEKDNWVDSVGVTSGGNLIMACTHYLPHTVAGSGIEAVDRPGPCHIHNFERWTVVAIEVRVGIGRQCYLLCNFEQVGEWAEALMALPGFDNGVLMIHRKRDGSHNYWM